MNTAAQFYRVERGGFEPDTRGVATGWHRNLLALASVAALSACTTTGTPLLSELSSAETTLRAAAAQLDVLAQDLERFGTISVSTPGMVFDLGARTISDLRLSNDALLAPPGVAGLSAANSQRERLVDIAANVAASALPAQPSATPASQDNPQVPQLGQAEPSRISKTFSDRLPPFDANKLELSRRERILLGKDDQVALAVANFMAAPKADAFGMAKRLYAAVMSVTLRPGRETYKDHIGEIELHLGWARKTNAEQAVERIPGLHPQAFGVFPALNSQVLDLRRSDRDLLALTAQLQGAAPQAAGALRAAYKRLLEVDRGTREVRNTVVGYNASGRQVGWRFTPRFTAQGDPAADDPVASSQLFEQSFPALVFFVADLDEICKSHGGTSEQNNCATHLVVQTTTRWLRARPSDEGRWAMFKRWLHDDPGARLSEVRANDWAMRLDRVFSMLESASRVGHVEKATTPTGSGHGLRNAETRFNAMMDATIGAQVYLQIPITKPAARGPMAITSVAPTHGWHSEPTQIVIEGRGFLQPRQKNARCGANRIEVTTVPPKGSSQHWCSAKFYVGGAVAKVVSVNQQGKTAVVLVNKDAKRLPAKAMDVTVVNAMNGSATLPAAITFDLVRPNKSEEEAEQPAVSSKVQVERNSAGQVTGLTVSGKVPDKAYEPLRPQGTTTPGPVTIEVRANDPSPK